METFDLLESGVMVEGGLLNVMEAVECKEAKNYDCSQGTNPVWMYNGRPIEVTLESPLVYAVYNEDRSVISVQSDIWIKESAKASLQIAVFITENSDTFYIVAGYSDAGVNGSEPDETYQINFEITVSPELVGKTSVEMYSFREDPKTSRGTVTTVMHTSPGA